MAPQPTQAPKEQTPAERQIERAKALERERADLMKRIGANRDYLRLMDQNQELDAKQGDWLEKFYPQKEKGEKRSDADIKATRAAKQEALKVEAPAAA